MGGRPHRRQCLGTNAAGEHRDHCRSASDHVSPSAIRRTNRIDRRESDRRKPRRGRFEQVELMKTFITIAMLLAVADTPRAQHDPLTMARELYASAAYEEALSELARHRQGAEPCRRSRDGCLS